jgi:hypothetical protein
MTRSKREVTSEEKTEEIVRRCTHYESLAVQRGPYSMALIATRHSVAKGTVASVVKEVRASTLPAAVIASIRADYKIGQDIEKRMQQDLPSKIALDLNVSYNTVRKLYVKSLKDEKIVKHAMPIVDNKIVAAPVRETTDGDVPVHYSYY